MSSRVPWTIYDAVANQETDLEINPQSFKVLPAQRTVSVDKTTAGQVLFFEGRASVSTLSFSGLTMTEGQLATIRGFATHRNQLKLTDDLGHTYWFYVTGLQVSRQLKRQVPWYHSYTVDAVILDWG